GGHLTHGSPVNFSGQLYRAVQYGVREEDGRIDYDALREIARRERPRVIMAGASAYARIIDFAAFAEIAREVEAIFIVDMAHITAAKAVAFHEALQPDFKNYARQIVANAKALAQSLMARGFDLVSGGTDNHLLLMDLRSRGDLSGKLAEEALGRAHITVNKNT